MERIIISKEKINKLINAIFENARELLNEANILFSNKKYARTYTLSQICLEELAKAKLFTDAFISTNDEYFYERLEVALGMMYNHQMKLVEAALIELEMEISKTRSGEEMKALNLFLTESDKAKEYDRNKNNSLYVDIRNDNILTPFQKISVEMASKRLKKAETLYEWSELSFKKIDKTNYLN